MVSTCDIEEEIKSWLLIVLKDDKLKNLSVNVLGNSEKGDGYLGDIVFVSANGTTEDESTKKYNLVIKCSKKSTALRETSPVKESFLNEIVFYEKVLPAFTQFQKDKGIEDPFDSVPKCYGSFTGENKEVIVFENLKNIGYELWPKKQPLTREHIDLVVTEYGKFHAISAAFKEQRPVEFQQLTDELTDVFKKFVESGDMQTLFGAPIDESYELLKNDLDENTLAKWKGFRDQVGYLLNDIVDNHTGLRAILHGDCWNNNFMHLHAKGNQNIPQKVAFLDWQISRYASPILDLSYFLFSCISKEDLEELDDILVTYYKSFINQLSRLNTEDPERLYSFNEFLNDWKTCSKFGVMMASLLMKIVSTDKDEVIDMAQIVENGQDFGHTFLRDIKDKDNYKRRIGPIVEYVIKHDLI